MNDDDSIINSESLSNYMNPNKKKELLKEREESVKLHLEMLDDEDERFEFENFYIKHFEEKQDYYFWEDNIGRFDDYNRNNDEKFKGLTKYLNKKYNESCYNPDDLELITYYQQCEDEDLSKLYLAEDNYYPDDYFSTEEYDKIMSQIPSLLKDEKGELNINKCIHCFRNALAHNQFNFTKYGITIGIQINDVDYFDFFVSYPFLQLILEDYINILLSKFKKSEDTPILKRIYASLFNDSETEKIYGIYSFKWNYDVEEIFDIEFDSYEEVKELIRGEFKKIGIENHFFELANMVESEVKLYNFADYEDIVIDNDIDIDKDKDSLETDMKSIVCIIKLFEYIGKYIANNVQKFNEIYKKSEILDILVNLDNVIYGTNLYDYKKTDILLTELIELFENYGDYKSIYPDFSNLNVLLNILLVQCSYENVDKDSIDLSRLTLNKEYFESKKNIFGPLIDKLNTKCEVLKQRINKLMESINSGKTSSDKIEFVNKMKEDKEQLQNNINKMKKEWDNSLKLSNASIFNHIRNAFAHGSYFIQVPKNGQDLKTINITIKDYEPETNKLTFSGTISIYDLLSQILKPEIINQLFPERIFNKTKMIW